jgi:hypothetical protein
MRFKRARGFRALFHEAIMSFEKLQIRRIVQTVFFAVIILTGLTVGVQGCYMSARTLYSTRDLPNDASQQDLQARMNEEATQMNREISQGAQSFTIVYMITWALAVVVTFGAGYWAARDNENPTQAAMTGIAVAFGIVSTYGFFCVLTASATNGGLLLIGLGFNGLLFAAGLLGGRFAGRLILHPRLKRQRSLPPAPTAAWNPAVMPAGTDVYFNMGIAAAMGGRREEARKHFGVVLQMAPHHIGAWLQLANLADTPQQAWDYIQQARAINPNDPAVQQAMNIIWPKLPPTTPDIPSGPSDGPSA